MMSLLTPLLLALLPPATAADVSEKIINGEDAAYEDYPMAGAVMLELGNVKGFICSSTLIAPDVVMTAAHCVDPEALLAAGGIQVDDSTEFRWSRDADLSAYSFNTTDWPAGSSVVAERAFHPDWSIYGLGAGLALNYDIGLMFLEEPVLDGPYAYLPTAEEATQLIEGVDVTVVGWGYQDEQGRTSGFKQQGVAPVGEVSDYELHVGPETDDVRKCHGDSGGPSFLFIETDTVDPMRVVGVTSHAYDNTDCNQTGGVDTRADYYLDWIDGELRRRCEDGTRAWCDEPGLLIAPLPPQEDTASPWNIPADLRSDIQLRGCAAAPGGPQGGALALLALLALARRRTG